MINTIKDIIAGQLHIDAGAIDDDADIFDDLGADSLDVVEMLMSVELTFSIAVPDDEIVNLKTLKDIRRYIDSNSAVVDQYTDLNNDDENADEKMKSGSFPE